jgi:hypothetical protein
METLLITLKNLDEASKSDRFLEHEI